jgi:hypothetical protein
MSVIFKDLRRCLNVGTGTGKSRDHVCHRSRRQGSRRLRAFGTIRPARTSLSTAGATKEASELQRRALISCSLAGILGGLASNGARAAGDVLVLAPEVCLPFALPAENEGRQHRMPQKMHAWQIDQLETQIQPGPGFPLRPMFLALAADTQEPTTSSTL